MSAQPSFFSVEGVVARPSAYWSQDIGKVAIYLGAGLNLYVDPQHAAALIEEISVALAAREMPADLSGEVVAR
ncbi:hypothetical protein [Nocardia sp. NBC_01327]|uniref:hypothetical protein n=1 Tax=Nocardia sp. NBC_01327 TaxID=2903593 RepID=UPI002E1329EE|nr:hypothetical protein OG326_24010 [Nocardia sp. NBC_01327]